MQSAQVTVRIPADHFEEARSQVRAIAKSVEQDIIEARDVTREYVDQEAALRNARAEEQQYLLILKRAASVKDVLEVSSKLAEVRAHIDRASNRPTLTSFPSRDVSASQLTSPQWLMAQVFGIRWRPLLQSQAITSGRTFLRGSLWRLYGGATCQSSGDSDLGIYHPGAAKVRMDRAATHRPSVLSFARHVVTSPHASDLDCICSQTGQVASLSGNPTPQKLFVLSGRGLDDLESQLGGLPLELLDL